MFETESLTFEAGRHRDFGIEQPGNWTGFLCLVRSFVKSSFVASGDAHLHIEVNGSNSEAGIGLLECQRRLGVDGLRRHTGIAELTAQRHRKAAGVRGSNQFLGICANAIFKSRAEGVLRLREDSALS